ncbi:hypothetical protein [Halocola ammonii]
MKRKFKYDPEDLESLLLNKKFEELYPEEREFVLKHMDSAKEYASMRKTLLSIVEQPGNDSPLKPKSSTKRKLMREFEEEKTATWKIWLNGIFLPFNRKPVLSYSLVAVVLIAGGLFFFNQQNADKVLLADNKEQSKEEKQEAGEARDIEKDLESNDNSRDDSEKELPSTEKEEELEELPPLSEPEPTATETAQNREIEVNEDVEKDAVKDLQLADATEKNTENIRPQADSEISKEEEITPARSENEESTDELAEIEQPQEEEEVKAERSVTATQINTDSFTMDDQMGNIAETTTIESYSRQRIKANVQEESTSMAKGAFLLGKLQTSM